MKVMKNDPDLLEEYDFSQGVRGKYAQAYKEGTNVVVLDPDLVAYFPDSESVNEALRSLVVVMERYREKVVEGEEGEGSMVNCQWSMAN